jgi:hypothetical protein
MVVATNAVAKHATMTDARDDGERTFAWFSSVTAVRIELGMDSKTRSQTLPKIITVIGLVGAPGSRCAPRLRRHIWTPGFKHVSTIPTSFTTANRPRCFVMRTARSTCGVNWRPRAASSFRPFGLS